MGAIAAYLAKPLIKWLLIAAGIAIPTAVAVIFWFGWGQAAAERDSAQHDLAAAVNANQSLKDSMIDLRRNQAMENAVTSAELQKMQQRVVSVEQVKKEQHNEAGATDLAGPYYDDLADRLRKLDADSGAVAH